MSTRDESESRTEPEPASDAHHGLLGLVPLETGPAAGIESRVMLERARARLLGRVEETPGRVGRYVVLQRIGAGAMGVVLRAYDPKLRREVALKIVRPRGGLSGTEAQTRLLREAQALAQLAHPHVVAVYDAEITQGGVCIAMEFVEGQTLRAWLRERSRAWPEVLGMLTSVVRGLAAAHATGLVHRDVKPDNCLVGTDGRLRVTDFGLARVTDGASSSLGDVPVAVDEDEPLTRDGTIMGTPPYMAPEQHEGSAADAATDQYAFGVLMWEALYGSRPFHGRTLQALTAAKRRGPPERPSKDVPRWLHEVVRRTLAVRPSDRWPSMPALLEAIVSGRARVRKQRAMLAVAGVGLAALGLAGWQQVDRHRTATACEELGASIHRDAWNDAMRSRLRAATRSETTYASMLSWIDPYVARWQELRTTLCLDEEIEGRFGSNVAAGARECLDERRDALAQLLEVLAEGEGIDSRRAVTAVVRLPPLDPCVDPAALTRRGRLPDAPQPLAEALELRRSLQRARGLAATERDAEALELAEALNGRAAAAGLSALELEISAFAGLMAGRAGRHEAAEATLRRVVVEAGALGMDEVAADAATALVSTVGQGLGRVGAALAHAETAALLVDRVEPEGRGPRHIRLLDVLARVHIEAGRDEEAERVHARAIEMAEAMLGPEHPLIADMLDVARASRSRDELGVPP